MRNFIYRRWLALLVIGIPLVALAGTIVDQGTGNRSTQAWMTDASAQFSGITTEVMVDNTTQTAMPATPLSRRRAIEIQNLGPNPIYCAVGPVSTPPTAVLTKSRRIEAATGSSSDKWALDIGPNVIVRCLAATADQVTGAATIVTELR